jgi:hypothetical protein
MTPLFQRALLGEHGMDFVVAQLTREAIGAQQEEVALLCREIFNLKMEQSVAEHPSNDGGMLLTQCHHFGPGRAILKAINRKCVVQGESCQKPPVRVDALHAFRVTFSIAVDSAIPHVVCILKRGRQALSERRKGARLTSGP